jgi:hypothetical protein
MKSIIYFPLVVLFFASCGNNQYRPRAELFIRKPGSKVEKAWVARNQFDHERRLLIPKIGGARWGAVQEYKEDGTIEFKDWWERDVKIEDLEATPTTAIPKSWGAKNQVSPGPPRLGLDQPIGLGTPPAPVPSFGVPPAGLGDIPAGPANPSFPDLPPLPPGDPSAFPPIDALPPIDGLPPMIDEPALPPGSNVPAPSPFAPLPGALPNELPEIGAPNELPAVPPGGDALPKEENTLPELPADPFEAVP